MTIREPDRSTAGTIVVFELGSAELDDEARERLKKVVPQFVGLPHKIDIRGHVTPSLDDDGSSSDALWNLCYKRCLAVKRYLLDAKIDEVRLRISVAGPHEPLVLDAKNQDPSKNSRVEVFLLSETVNDFKPVNSSAKAGEESHSEKATEPKKAAPAAKAPVH